MSIFGSDKNPETEEQARLMLLGAMYVEDNDILKQIEAHPEYRETDEALKETLTQGFSMLDMNMADYSEDDVKTLLKENWKIEKKNDLIGDLDYLLKGGSNDDVQFLLDFIKKNPDTDVPGTLAAYKEFSKDRSNGEEFGDTEELFASSIKTIRRKEKELLSTGTAGWDLARYAHLIRLGFLGGYLKAGESWKLLEKIKEPAAKAFSNWPDFAKSYMLGRNVWSGSASSLDDACERLLTNPLSPWKVFDWAGK